MTVKWSHSALKDYEGCARRYHEVKVLKNYPFKDTEATQEQYYDEDAQKKRDRMGQVLGIPVTDFELSVRSRNCLKKMNIRTVGELMRLTEAELPPTLAIREISRQTVPPDFRNRRIHRCWEFRHRLESPKMEEQA